MKILNNINNDKYHDKIDLVPDSYAEKVLIKVVRGPHIKKYNSGTGPWLCLFYQYALF